MDFLYAMPLRERSKQFILIMRAWFIWIFCVDGVYFSANKYRFYIIEVHQNKKELAQKKVCSSNNFDVHIILWTFYPTAIVLYFFSSNISILLFGESQNCEICVKQRNSSRYVNISIYWKFLTILEINWQFSGSWKMDQFAIFETYLKYVR